MQVRAPASSTSFMIQPPWTLPSRLACSGCINWESVIRDALIGLGTNRSILRKRVCQEFTMSKVMAWPETRCLLVHIFSQLTAIKGVQTLGFLNQDIHQTVRQVAH